MRATIEKESIEQEMPMISLLNGRVTRAVGKEILMSFIKVASLWPLRSTKSGHICGINGATNEGEIITGTTFDIVGSV